jgi:hypothetical protein
MARDGDAVVTDASETSGVSVAIGLGELCEAISTGGEPVVADSAVGVSVAIGFEFCEAISTGGELPVADSVVRVSVAIGLAEPCKAASTGGELLVPDSAVGGVGDAATDGVFGCCVTPRIAKTSTTPVNSATIPQGSWFVREAGRACVGSGGGAMVDCGGAPHEGQAGAKELISLPHS